MAGPQLEVVHVGSACRDIDARRPPRLAARRRRHVRGPDDGPARPADRGGHRRRRRGRRGARARPPARRRRRRAAGPARRGPGLRKRRDAGGAGPDLRPARRAARRYRPCPGRGGGARAGRSCRSPTRSPTAGPRSIPAEAYVAVGWQGILRELARRAGGGPPRSAAVGRPRAGRDLVGVSHQDVEPGPARDAGALLHPGRGPARHPGRARAGCSSVVGGTGRRVRALPADRDRPRGRPDRRRRHVPRGAASLGAAAGDRRSAPVAAPRGPAVRGRGRLARRRGAGPRRRPGPCRGHRPAGPRAGPSGGRPERARRSGRAASSRRTERVSRALAPRPRGRPPLEPRADGGGPPRGAVRAGRAGAAGRSPRGPRRAAPARRGGSRSRCSRSLASSIAATMAVRPGPAASAVHASTASPSRPSRRRR